MESVADRFERWTGKQPTELGCLLWLGSPDGAGYGRFYIGDRKFVAAHRWSYEHSIGPVPDGKELHHLCDTPLCVNPAHLVALTRAEHARLGKHASQTHCKNGHPFDSKNTYLTPSGSRACRACRRNDVTRYKQSPKGRATAAKRQRAERLEAGR